MTVAFRPMTKGGGRAYDQSDRTFVVEGWLESYRPAHSAGLIAMEDWFDVMRPQVNKVLDRRHVTTILAYESDDAGQMYGFITADQSRPSPLVYYAWVKQPYRKNGFARALFNAIGIDPRRPFRYVCKTGSMVRLADKIPMAKWDPLAGRFPSQEKPSEQRAQGRE